MYQANSEEQKVLKYWEDNKTFEKSVSERPEDKPYVFYDGPPFATGLPHYGHIVASLMKDVVPRYWTMNGYRVERKWGWDCHGLPIENIIEKDLNLKTKQDIENLGIGNFNEACRSTVLKYAEEWKKTIKRMGRWVDMKNDYKTMDVEYMESVWWVFKQLWNKDLIYKGYKAMHICPRCVTPLSNFEVTQNYKDVKDLSATVKFKIKNPEKYNLPANSYILAWTTTPWTLPGNVLLAVKGDIDYVLVEVNGEDVILAKERLENVLKDKEYKIKSEIKGLDLVGMEYEPLFPYFSDTENAFKVVLADFVTTTDGTGVVHIAPAFGEDDYNVGKEHNVGWVQHVTMEGKFVPEVLDFAGGEVKPIDEPSKMDIEIIKWLANNKDYNKLFSKEKVEHSYPHCWRCDTPLLNYSTASWFVNVVEMKDQLLKNNKKINWVPEHIKDGRFGLWLEGARDWAVSRNRYWGTPLPIWESEDGDWLCIGSVEELESLTGKKVNDLHKHIVDELVIEKDGKIYKRIPEVLDCWFESGSMPYGQMHYPFENKAKFEAGFPAEFIAEGQDQTRGWFYTLHILATALTDGKEPIITVKQSEPAFKNVIVNGIVLAEDGKKMSKRLKNYPDPLEVLEKYGADAMRYYLVSSPVMYAESLNFSEVGVREMYNKIINTLSNVLVFYSMFATYGAEEKDYTESGNVLDKWILTKLNLLVGEVTEKMNEYKLAEASRPILDFIDELSTWYVRRSRDRFKLGTTEEKKFAIATLREVLLTLSKVMAPFTPFMAEKIWQTVTSVQQHNSTTAQQESVHLQAWPEVKNKTKDETEVLNNMSLARKVVEMGLSLRAENGVKVRQPLSRLMTYDLGLTAELKQIVADELNIKSVEDKISDGDFIVKEDSGLKIGLDITLTDDLKKEGLLREVVRTINQIRKEQKMTIEDRVAVEYSTEDELLQSVFVDFAEELKKSVLATEVVKTSLGTSMLETEIDGKKVRLSVVTIK